MFISADREATYFDSETELVAFSNSWSGRRAYDHYFQVLSSGRALEGCSDKADPDLRAPTSSLPITTTEQL